MAYFLGKVCIARHLEPRILEKCLVTKLSYHFEEGIVHARLCGQVKTIGAMEALLDSIGGIAGDQKSKTNGEMNRIETTDRG